jgi:hypothetical protein
MPKRSRDELQSIFRLCERLDALAAEAKPGEVASRCASFLSEALESWAVVIHRYDALERELRIIGAHGFSAVALLGVVTKSEDDFVATTVLANESPLTMRLDGSLPSFMPERHRLLGTSRSLWAVPVFGSEGCVAVIEVTDTADDRAQSVAAACELVAQRLVAAFETTQHREPARPDSDVPVRRRESGTSWMEPPVRVRRFELLGTLGAAENDDDPLPHPDFPAMFRHTLVPPATKRSAKLRLP